MGRKTVYNQIVTDEEYELVNEDNKELMEEFLDYMEVLGRSPLTIKNYRSDIKICFIWSLKKAKNKFFVDFAKKDIIRYQGWLTKTLGLSRSRVRRLKSSISSMSNYIETILDDEYPNFRNIVNSIETPGGESVRKKTVFTNEDIEELLSKIISEGYIQEACAVALAACSGARKSELRRFKTHYFDDENKKFEGSLYQTPEPIKTKGRDGGKLLTKYVLTNPFDDYLALWLNEREEKGIDNECLFVRSVDGKWEQAIDSTLDSWARTINRFSEKHFYWHSLRHYFTTKLSRNNIPAEVIKSIVGWESVDMVSIYDDTPLSDELGKYFGGGGINKIEEGKISNLKG